MRVKFDVSDFERIVLGTVKSPLIHVYSDADACASDILTYRIEEVLAEKLRSWIQRTRSRDLYDAVRIIQQAQARIDKRQILNAFV